MSKKIIFVWLLCNTILTIDINCMVNSEIIAMTTTINRKTLDIFIELNNLNSTNIPLQKIELLKKMVIQKKLLYSLKNPTEEEKKYDCMAYALANTIGLKDAMYGKFESCLIPLIQVDNYFKPTDDPQRDDLAFYTSSEDILDFKHCGIFIDYNRILSKWGTTSIIAEHKLFNIPTVYDDYVYFSKLEKKFEQLAKSLQIDKKKFLIDIIRHDIAQSKYGYQIAFGTILLKYYKAIANLKLTNNVSYNQSIIALALFEPPVTVDNLQENIPTRNLIQFSFF